MEVKVCSFANLRIFRYSQVTPRTTYLNRRRFLAAGSAALGALAALRAASNRLQAHRHQKSVQHQRDSPLRFEAITHYNNFYEFGTDKEDPSKNAHKLRTSPWSVKVEGAVAKPNSAGSGRIFTRSRRSKNASTGTAAWRLGPW